MKAYINHSAVPNNTEKYEVIGQKSIYSKNGNGDVSLVKELPMQAGNSEIVKDKSLLKKEGYLGIFKLIFKNAMPDQKKRVLDALDEWGAMYVILETHNWELAKERVEDMLKSKDIKAEDKVLIDKYINLAQEVL